jgi:RNA-binding protein
MNELTGKQKRFLRAMGQSLPAAIQVGKDGADEGFVAQLRVLLGRQELVKVRLPAIDREDRSQMAQELAAAAGAAFAGAVGRMILLYRQNPDLDPDKQISLP